MKIRLATYLEPDSIVDGEGIRTVVWTQGCSHNCEGCHNPSTHDFKGGFEVDTDEIINDLNKIEFQRGITFSGGDPMFQAEACNAIAVAAKAKGLNVWCYTGFTFEELLNNPKTLEFLKNIDVLVDGKFILKQRSLNLDFRGSKNQRIIDVPKSLKENKVILAKKYMQEKNVNIEIKKEEHIYI